MQLTRITFDDFFNVEVITEPVIRTNGIVIQTASMKIKHNFALQPILYRYSPNRFYFMEPDRLKGYEDCLKFLNLVEVDTKWRNKDSNKMLCIKAAIAKIDTLLNAQNGQTTQTTNTTNC